MTEEMQGLVDANAPLMMLFLELEENGTKVLQVYM